MKIMLALCAVALALVASPVRAQENPAVLDWNDVRRFSVGAQAGYRWFTDANYPFSKEWMIGGSGAWALGQKSAIRLAIPYGLDNRLFSPQIGWHLDLGQHPATGTAAYGVTLGYAWNRMTGGRLVPAPAQDEFQVGVAVAWPVSDNAALGGGADYGVSSGIIGTRIVGSVNWNP